MQHLVFECSTEQECRDLVDKLWRVHNIAGELSVRVLPGERWRVEVNAEKELRESTLEKFAAYRVGVGA